MTDSDLQRYPRRRIVKLRPMCYKAEVKNARFGPWKSLRETMGVPHVYLTLWGAKRVVRKDRTETYSQPEVVWED